MIRLHYSNRTEHMVRALAEQLARRVDPLEAATIVVPNRPMERWVEMRLAETLGIAVNLRFMRLERFVSERVASDGGPRVLGSGEIEGRVLAVLQTAVLQRESGLVASSLRATLATLTTCMTARQSPPTSRSVGFRRGDHPPRSSAAAANRQRPAA